VAQSYAARNNARITRWRSIALTFACIAAGGVAFYSANLYVSFARGPKPDYKGPVTQSELTDVYNRTARSFDLDVGFSERLMGIMSIRERLAKQCKGHVLEVSSGTARNLGYYNLGQLGKSAPGIRSLTLLDISEGMVEQGRRKWEVLRATDQEKRSKQVPVRFFTGDALRQIPPPPRLALRKEQSETQQETVSEKRASVSAIVPIEENTKGYDTILQTLGLCSTDAPVELLQNLSAHLDQTNPNARILLLEHGRSYFDWLNRILDTYAAPHADRHGCWWNRDIGDIVDRSGLEVVRLKRRHFGTSWIYELKVPEVSKTVEGQSGPGGPEGASEEQKTDEVTGFASLIPRWAYEKICKR